MHVFNGTDHNDAAIITGVHICTYIRTYFQQHKPEDNSDYIINKMIAIPCSCKLYIAKSFC